MPGEKRFRTSFVGGFKKYDVNIYIEKILREFEDKFKEKDDEITVLKNQNRDFKAKYEELLKRTDEINANRSKIAEVLIKAQEKAQVMLEDARHEALEERKQLERIIEQEKEKLTDIRKEMHTLKQGIVGALRKYEEQLEIFVTEDDRSGLIPG